MGFKFNFELDYFSTGKIERIYLKNDNSITLELSNLKNNDFTDTIFKNDKEINYLCIGFEYMGVKTSIEYDKIDDINFKVISNGIIKNHNTTIDKIKNYINQLGNINYSYVFISYNL